QHQRADQIPPGRQKTTRIQMSARTCELVEFAGFADHGFGHCSSEIVKWFACLENGFVESASSDPQSAPSYENSMRLKRTECSDLFAVCRGERIRCLLEDATRV